MKILAPLRSFEQIDSYIVAGADEFYFGFIDSLWEKEFGNNSVVNRISAMGTNATNFMIDEIEEVVHRIHEKGKKGHITLNGSCYTLKQVNYLEKVISNMKEKPDGIVFSDIKLIPFIIDQGCTPIASTMCGIYNNDILNYYITSGAQRIVLPRELNLNEIKKMTEDNPGVDFETFIMRDGCMFSDSHCLGIHKENFGGLCSYIRQSDYKFHGELSNKNIKKYKYRYYLYLYAMLQSACGLCAIYRMAQMKINSLKIVGRADRTEEVAKDIKAVKDNINIAKSCNSEQEYLKKMFIPERWKMVCGMSCYYPEVSEFK